MKNKKLNKLENDDISMEERVRYENNVVIPESSFSKLIILKVTFGYNCCRN